MRAVVQRVSKASVKIDGRIKSSINQGLVILLGIAAEDTHEDAEWLGGKIARLRIFNDEDGIMNKSLQEIEGEAIVVSQFTLHAGTKKGNRPSYIKAAGPDHAIPLYDMFVQLLEQHLGKPVGTGEFGAMMDVELVNSGPVTIIIDTKKKE